MVVSLNRKNLLICYSITLFFGVLDYDAYAQEKNAVSLDSILTMSIHDLMNVKIITASKSKDLFSEAPGIISIISSKEIKDFGANSLFEILERVTSVYMTGSSFFPQNVFSMRGDLLNHYGNHVLILINGRSMRETYAGGTNMSVYTAFPVSVIDQIEVIRGPGAALYGTNAYTGVINIITKVSENNELRTKVGYGSLNTIKAELGKDYKSEKLKLSFNGTFFKEKGWRLKAVDNNGVDSSMYMGEENFSLFLDAESKNIRFSSLYIQGWQNFFGSTVAWDAKTEISKRRMSSRRAFSDLSYRIKASDKLNFQFHTTYNFMEFELSNYTSYSNNIQEEVCFHYSPRNNMNFTGGSVLWYMFDGSKEGTSTAPVPGYSSLWWSSYLQMKFEFKKWLEIIAGGQLNKPENVELDLVPRLGLIMRFTDKIGLKAQYAQAFRSAFGVETGFSLILYNDDNTIRGGLRGNPDLLPEKITTSDFQIYYHTQKLHISLTGFDSHQKQLITRLRAADNVMDYINKGELRSRGAELECKMNLSKNLFVTSSVSYERNEKDSIENYTTVPNFMLKAGVSYKIYKGTQLGVFNSYIGEAGDVNVINPDRKQVNRNAEGYNLLTAKLGIDFNEFLSLKSKKYRSKLNLYVYNLLGEKIFHPEFAGRKINTLPARAGRSVYVSLGLRF